eukprot:scaffold5865_cov186-Amphora_coffeaeformis.AAC.7
MAAWTGKTIAASPAINASLERTVMPGIPSTVLCSSLWASIPTLSHHCRKADWAREEEPGVSGGLLWGFLDKNQASVGTQISVISSTTTKE